LGSLTKEAESKTSKTGRALTIAGTSGRIADPLALRTQLELARHHLDSASAALSKYP
jgi:hypothetical protein